LARGGHRNQVGAVSVTGTELATLVVDAARSDATLAADLAAVLSPHLQRHEQPCAAGWMTSREAATYLGLTLPALHRLTAARAVPFEQDAPGGKCWFNRADLDAWRRGRGARSLPQRA
jgi:excisionase family DNA binding protein